MTSWKNGVVEKTIYNCGTIWFNFQDVPKPCHEFFIDLFTEVAKNCRRYYKNSWGDHVFRHKESQMNTVICPAIHKISKCFLMEEPVTRKRKNEPHYTGLTDYWIDYNNYSILVEYKHCNFNYRNPTKPKENIAKQFKIALKQLNRITPSKTKHHMYDRKAIFKIALETIEFWKGSKKDNLSYDTEKKIDFKHRFEEMLKNAKLSKRKSLDKAINVRGLWRLHKNLIEYDVEEDYEISPALGIIAMVEGPIT